MDELKKAYSLALSMCAVMALSFMVFAYTVHFISARLDPFEGLFPLIKGNTLKYALLGITIAVSLLVRLLKYMIPSGKLTVHAPKFLSEHLPEKLTIRSEILQRLLLTWSIIFGACGLVAVFGVAVFLVSGKLVDFYIFLVLSLILLAANFPLYRDWERFLLDEADKGGPAENKPK